MVWSVQQVKELLHTEQEIDTTWDGHDMAISFNWRLQWQMILNLSSYKQPADLAQQLNPSVELYFQVSL